MTINIAKLNAIHAGAFDEPAFRRLTKLILNVDDGPLVVHSGAFRNLRTIRVIYVAAENVQYLADDIMRSASETIVEFLWHDWPNLMNLNQLTANTAFPRLIHLQICNVHEPQTTFHVLAPSNFTSMCCLRTLWLVDCGIEFIEQKTFDGLGRSLTMVNLRENRIQFVTARMFRSLFDAHRYPIVRLGAQHAEIICTCRFLEFAIMQCPNTKTPGKMCNPCQQSDFLTNNTCGIFRHSSDMTKYCRGVERHSVRYVAIRMAYIGNSVWINTNFSNQLRVVMVDAAAMRALKCTERKTEKNYVCYNLKRRKQIKKILKAEIQIVVAIPFTFFFGARAMHLITVRQEPEDANGWCIGYWVGLSIFVGFVVGFGFRIGHAYWRAKKVDTEAAEANHTNIQDATELRTIEQRPSCVVMPNDSYYYVDEYEESGYIEPN